MTYNPAYDKFYLKGKEVSHKPKDFMRLVCEYAIYRISLGENIIDLFPIQSKTAPILANIFEYIDNDKALAELHAKAEQARLRITKEKLMKVMDIYRNNPTPENKDLFVAVQKAFESLSKSHATGGNVILNYHSIFPKSFWEKRKISSPPEKVDDN